VLVTVVMDFMEMSSQANVIVVTQLVLPVQEAAMRIVRVVIKKDQPHCTNMGSVLTNVMMGIMSQEMIVYNVTQTA